jgi:hypothetical protein
MALKLGFASLSLGASVDQQTGNLSVFEIVEEIRTPQVPIQLQALVISIALNKTDDLEFRGKIMIHILTPDGKQAMVGSGDIQIPPDQKRMRAVFRFGGFPVHQFGAHRFVVSWLNQASTKVGEAILDFEVMQVTQVAQGVAPSDNPGMAH